MSAVVQQAQTVGLAEANRACAEVTRQAAANFYYGIRLLPPAKRRAMSAVYAFARRIDDIGDGELPDERKLELLQRERAQLAAASLSGPDPVLVALADAHRRFGLPLSSLEDLIDGVRMDVVGESYPDLDRLVLYCRRVAGSIGRLSLAIFGSEQLDRAWQLADDLGVAMQLTNILRDLREDALRGRVYLPAEDLVRYRLRPDGAIGAAEMAELTARGALAEPSVVKGMDGGDVGQLFALMRFQALRAEEWFGRGMELLGLLDRRSAACVSAMTGIYRRVLERIQDRPDAALADRVSLPVSSKAWVALQSVLVPHRVPRRDASSGPILR